MVNRPLAGLRLLDLTRFVSGSWATALLGALGADVIKVEVPPGDPYREQGTERIAGRSALFLSLNQGKRSVALDFRSPIAQGAIGRLIEASDMLVENSRPGALARHGLDWETVHERNPALVYGSISGYGDVGPDAAKGGFDLILQAESGLMSVTGEPRSGPVKVGAPVLDVGAGLSCALGLVAAHVERLRTGIGRRVSSSLFEFGLGSLSTLAAGYLAGGELPGLLGTHSPTFAPYGGFRTSDGWVVMAGAGSEEMWQRCCRALGVPELLDDERFRDNAARVSNRDELTERLEVVLTSDTTDHWLKLLAAEGVPAADVKDLAQALGSDQAAALGSVQEVPHPDLGVVRLVAPPLRFDGLAVTYTRPAPELGADTRSVLVEVGMTPMEIDGLVEAGVAVAP